MRLIGRPASVLTYVPGWVKESGIRELSRMDYTLGRGSEAQRVAFIDQETGRNDLRATLCFAVGITPDQVDQATGHALVPWPGR